MSKESRTMTERPLAELHADAIEVHLTFDGAFAALEIVSEARAFIISLPRNALEEFVVHAIDKIVATSCRRGARQI
jgi:hypothetical protein